jgi:outer membrane protein assembly factor BamB
MASNPVIRDGRVIFASHDNTVHAVDAAATGEEAWWQPQDAVITSQLCLVGDSLMFGTDTMEMIVLDANDGSFVAAYPLAHVPVGTMSYRKPLLVFLAAGVEGPPRHVSALDLGTGHIEWSRGVPDPDPDVYWRVPRIHRWKSNVIMGSSKGLLVAYDETSGEPVWMLQLEGAIRGIGHAGDVLLVGTFQGMLHALTFAGNGGH